EQKLARESIRRSEAKFRALFDASTDAVMMLDQDGFVDCNPATLKMFGVTSADHFCRLHPSDISPPTQPCGGDSHHLAKMRIDEALRNGSAWFEWVHVRADDGKPFFGEVLLSALKLDGRPILQAV